jgi:hypothetical protein
MVPVLLLAGQPVGSQETADTYYREWVDYRDGEISMAFDQTPVELALDAIRVRTGLQIIVPLASANRLLSLQLERAPLEPAVRSFITYIGFKNFALMYDADGRPNRAVVLTASEEKDGRIAAQSQDAQAKERVLQPLTAAEQEKIHKELERWSDLKNEERGRIEDRLKNLPPSQERELLIAEYGRQLLGVKGQDR